MLSPSHTLLGEVTIIIRVCTVLSNIITTVHVIKHNNMTVTFISKPHYIMFLSKVEEIGWGGQFWTIDNIKMSTDGALMLLK